MLNQFIIVSTKKSHSAEGGFTLVELMVTIAVLAIIVSIATPSMSRQFANTRVKNTASLIEESLKAAIAESSIRGQSLTYSIDTNTQEIKLEAEDPKKKLKPDTKPILLRTYNYDESSNVTIKGNQTPSFKIGPGKRIRSTTGDNTLSIDFEICDNKANGETKRIVSINAIAQVRQSTDGSCS